MKKIKSINKKWQKFLISESGFGEQIIQEGPTDTLALFKAEVPNKEKRVKGTKDKFNWSPHPSFGTAKPVGLWYATKRVTDEKTNRTWSDVYYLAQQHIKPNGKKSNVWVYVMAGPYVNGLSDAGLTGLLAQMAIVLSNKAGQGDVAAELENRGFINKNAKTTPVKLATPPKGSTIRQTPPTVDVNDSKPKAGSWYKTTHGANNQRRYWRYASPLGTTPTGRWSLRAYTQKRTADNTARLTMHVVFTPSEPLEISTASKDAAFSNRYMGPLPMKNVTRDRLHQATAGLNDEKPRLSIRIDYPLDPGTPEDSQDMIPGDLRSGEALKDLGKRMVAHYASIVPELPDLGGRKGKVAKARPASTKRSRRRRGSTPGGFTAYHVARQKKLLSTELKGLSMKGLQGLLWIAAKALKIEPGLGTTGDLDLDNDGTMDGIDGQYYTKTYNLIVKLQKKFFGKGGVLTGDLKGRDNIDGLVGLGTLAKISKLFKIPGDGEDTAARLLSNLDIEPAEVKKLQSAFEQLKDEIPDNLLGSVPEEILRVISSAAPAVAQGTSEKAAVKMTINNRAPATFSGPRGIAVPKEIKKESHSQANDPPPTGANGQPMKMFPEFYSSTDKSAPPWRALTSAPGNSTIQVYAPMKKVENATNRVANPIIGKTIMGGARVHETLMRPGGHLASPSKEVESWMPNLFSHLLPESYKLWDGPYDTKSNRGGLNWRFPNHEIINSIRILKYAADDPIPRRRGRVAIEVWLKSEASKKYADTRKLQGKSEKIVAMQRKKPTIDIKMMVVYSEEEMVLNFDSIIGEPK